MYTFGHHSEGIILGVHSKDRDNWIMVADILPNKIVPHFIDLNKLIYSIISFSVIWIVKPGTLHTFSRTDKFCIFH